MTIQTFTTGQILTAAEMNALAQQAGGAAQTANNLSDLASATTARSNIGAGTVNSVSLAMPGDFSVAGSPVTNIGTLTVTRATQAANLVQAGPASGVAAVPTYRALVAGDVPPIGGSMAFQVGRFYTPNCICVTGPSSAFSTGSLIAGTPIFVPTAVTLQTLSCETGGTVSGTAHARMALYTDAGGVPGVPVAGADSGDLTQTSAGVLTSANLGIALAPAWYWPVWESSGLAGGQIYAATQARTNAQMGGNIVSGLISNAYRTYLMTHTYGAALPNPWATSSEGAVSVMPVVALGF